MRTPADRRTAQQRASQHETEADKDFDLRALNGVYRVWSICRNKSCQRARSCKGNASVCFNAWWPILPEYMKIQLRVFVRARNAGCSASEAWRDACEQAALYQTSQGETPAPVAGNSVPQNTGPGRRPLTRAAIGNKSLVS